MFWCLLHHLQGEHYITCSKTVCILQCCYKMYNIYCFFIYNAVTMFKTLCISPFFIFKILKTSVKILSWSTLISVGSCYLLCMLAIYLFTVSSCVRVRKGVEILRGKRERGPFKTSTPLRTQTQWTHILPTYIIHSRSLQIVMRYN
jgi:hypothetical protein